MPLERIASLEPSVTATLVALGQKHRLVAVTRYCSRLVKEGLEDIPKLETTWSVKADDVAALDPQLVIAGPPYQAGNIDSLLKAKLNVLSLYPERLDDVYGDILCIGLLCNASAEAEALVARMKAAFADLQRQAAGKPKQRVFVEMWPKPLMNGVSWIADIVKLLGGEVVPAPHGRQVTHEEVIEADPQVIILAWAGKDKMNTQQVPGRTGWENVSAVRSGKVMEVKEILLSAPGPNLVDGARELLHAMYTYESS